MATRNWVLRKNNETNKHLKSIFAVAGEAMNLFLNDNWRNVANEIKPVLEDTIADIFKKFSNKIYHKYPLSVLLPP